LTTTNSTENNLVGIAAFAMKLLALLLVVVAVIKAVDFKLEDLKANNEAWKAGYVSVEDKTRQLECLARNIYWEAASEPFEGKVAVAQVTMNRVESGKFANTVCGVVYQKNVFYEKVVCQFSWYCEGTHRQKTVQPTLWKESQEVAKLVFLEGFRLPGMKQALYYHADYVNPRWGKPKIDQIGRHIFYGDRT
jgi:spore germination cell wall hydrolase CwlJ-like protein